MPCPLVVPETGHTTAHVIPAPCPSPQFSGDFPEVVARHCHSEPTSPHTPQETMREKIFSPLTVESAVDAR